MVSERDRRIARFRKVSGYLLWVSMPMLILVGLGGFIGLIKLILAPINSTTLSTVTFSIVDGTFKFFSNNGFSWQSKLILIPLYSALFGICMYVLFHFQKLIECFFDGEVFNRITITHARKAYRMNLYLTLLLFAIYLPMVVFCVFSSTEGNAVRLSNFFSIAIGSLINLGFLSLILWALEIGTDLNEDAELTI